MALFINNRRVSSYTQQGKTMDKKSQLFAMTTYSATSAVESITLNDVNSITGVR